MIIIQNKQEMQKEEGFKPIPKNCCPECQREMEQINGKFNCFKCFKCGIEVENP